jgi:RNA polymerase sigma-70 factor, ECF subfamily
MAEPVGSKDDSRKNSSVSEDQEDIQNSRLGDSDAYKRLIDRYQDHVSSIVWRFSRDRLVHEELVQDVFVEAYLSLHTFKGKAPFSHWLSRIATRVGYRFWKQSDRQRRIKSLGPEEWKQIRGQMSDDISAIDAAELLHSLLDQLSPRDRLVLTLRFLNECDVAETARRTGWSKTMVKVQTLRAKRKLEKILSSQE